MTEKVWFKIEGMVVAGSLDPYKVAKLLKNHGVVAHLEWYEATPELLGLTVACDGEHVGVLGKRSKHIKTGPTVKEVAELIADKFSAEVMLGDVQVDKFVGFDEGEDEAASRFASIVEGTEKLPIRVAELSHIPSSAIPLLAAFEGVDIAELDHDEERRILLTQVPARRVGWQFGEPPMVVLSQQGDEFKAQFIPDDDPENVVTFNWGMKELTVAGAKGWEKGAGQEIEELVGSFPTVAIIHQAVPGVDLEAAFEASQLSGPEAAGKFIQALGLNPQIAEFLSGQITLEQVTGATLHHARGISNAIGRSVDILLDERRGDLGFWDDYTRTLEDKPWVIPTLAGAQAALALLLLVTGRKQEGKRSRGAKFATVGGLSLLLNAASNVALARRVILKMERHREEDVKGEGAPENGTESPLHS